MPQKPSFASALIVEDDPVFAAFTEALLIDAGCGTVATALNEAEFRAILASGTKHDLVLLDLNMPGLDGLAAMRILADEGFSGQIALVSGAQSAIVEAAANLARLFQLNLAGTLVKPLRAGELEALVGQIQCAGTVAVSGVQPARSDPSAASKLLVPVYQPKFSADGSRILGAEALMRVRLDDGGLGSPADYLAMLTATDKLGEATLGFLDCVLTDVQTWQRSGACGPVSVNVPAPLLEADGYMQRFAQILRERGVLPSAITIEVTESAMPRDLPSFVEIATRLRMAGFGLALDDYGTGMSNYDILRLCPFTELKIDRSVVQASTQDALACGFIGNCVAIARTLNLKVVAEGVETEDQAEAMRRLGVNIIQGYLYSRPLTNLVYAGLMRSAAAA
jgi:EAL domain-containing protein (putative c-di-GMP-specific phosphodiesterase class I)/ActR/RegA family two-component response regulator